jgi:ribonuclease HI
MSDQPTGPVAYTDGGCVGNPGPGGWGVHVEYPDGRVVELGGGELETTNNRMELRAAIEAARAVASWPAATIIADSQYVLRGITQWIQGWKRKDWVTSTGEPVLNRDLWEELDAVASDRLTWQWAKGHSGVPGNERCDAIASWFSSSVGRLGGSGRADRATTVARRTAAASRPVRASGERAAAPVASKPSAAPRAGQWYISVVDGIPARHEYWGACESRVKGVKGAKFKKVRNSAEEQEAFAKWGVTANDLFGI